jgi:hypothetical protein
MELKGEENGTITTFRGHAALPSSGKIYGYHLSDFGVIIIAVSERNGQFLSLNSNGILLVTFGF